MFVGESMSFLAALGPEQLASDFWRDVTSLACDTEGPYAQ